MRLNKSKKAWLVEVGYSYKKKRFDKLLRKPTYNFDWHVKILS